MATPKISVLTATARPDFLGEMAKALKEQTFKDFEWVVVDDNYLSNSEGLKRLVGNSYPLIHMLPFEPVSYFAKASALNDGLTACRGKVIYFLCDYVLPYPEAIERHWYVQEKLGGVMLSGRRIKIECDFDTFMKKQKEGEEFPWSDFTFQLFEKDKVFPWTPLGDDLFEVGRHGVHNWMNGRNDSCPLEPLLECNGFDQSFDGAWGGEDADMAERLMTFGLRFILDKGSSTLELPHTSGIKKGMRSADEQKALSVIMNKKVELNIYRANDEFIKVIPRDLKKQRESYLITHA